MKTKTIHHKALVFSCIFFLLNLFATAQTLSVFDYLGATEGAQMTIELDLTELINSKNTNQYFPASLTTPDGAMMKLEVRPRGKFRRRTCDIPPIKLKFPKKELRKAQLDTLNEIKLVVPCFDSPRGEDLLLREYVAYRMFERLSPMSVRARLVKIAFRDKHVEQVREPVYCLLVEHEEQVAARLKGNINNYFELPADSLQTNQAAITSLFQFMIGNTDWGVADGRNLYMLKQPGDDKVQIIPFDFDFAGLVNAPYAVPNSDSGLKKVQDRYLMAHGLPEGALQEAYQTMLNAHDDLIQLCNGAYLPKNSAKSLTKYVEDFFTLMRDKPISRLRPKGDLR